MTTITIRNSFLLNTHVLKPSALLFQGHYSDSEVFDPPMGVLPHRYDKLLSSRTTGPNYLALVYQPTTIKLLVRSRFDDIEYLSHCQTCLYRTGYKCKGIVKEVPSNKYGRCYLHPNHQGMQTRHMDVDFPTFIQHFYTSSDYTRDFKLLVPGPANREKTRLLVTSLYTGNTYAAGRVCVGNVDASMYVSGKNYSPINSLEAVFRATHNRDTSIPYTGSLSSWFKNFRDSASFEGVIKHQLASNYYNTIAMMNIGPYNMFVPQKDEVLIAAHKMHNLTHKHPPEVANLLIETSKRYFNVPEQKSYPLQELTLQ